MNEFEQAWNLFHPDSHPVGFMMREAGEPNWLRFHSLPHSKRYAENAGEREILLTRQNALAAEVLGIGNPIWLAQARWASAGARDKGIFRARDDYNLRWAFRFLTDEGDGEMLAWDVHAALTVWTDHNFDELLGDIADDRTSALWMSAVTGAVFAPYDGGIDLFLPGSEMVWSLKDRYSTWSSEHSQGL